jgi:arginase family enzyme
MDYLSLFLPIPDSILPEQFNREQLGSRIRAFSPAGGFPEYNGNSKPDFAIIGVNMYQFKHPSNQLIHIPNLVRKELYSLFTGTFSNVNIADWGNFCISENEAENQNKLIHALSEAIQNNVIPIIIGGGQEITWLYYLAYKKMGRFFNLLSLDPKPDFQADAEEINSDNYLSHIIFDPDNYMFNYSILGYQNYLVAPSVMDTMEKLFFEVIRLGDVRAAPEIAEPVIRDADCISLDMNSVKASDARAVLHPEPNGFRSEEICKMARYCGMSYKLNSFGLYNLSPYEENRTTLKLAAQVIWHLLDGFYSRMDESSDFTSNEFIRYDVSSPDTGFDIRFYKNRLTGRWWMSLPLNEEKEIKFGSREYIIPCTEQDYLESLRGEIPERWFKAEKKLNF